MFQISSQLFKLDPKLFEHGLNNASSRYLDPFVNLLPKQLLKTSQGFALDPYCCQ